MELGHGLGALELRLTTGEMLEFIRFVMDCTMWHSRSRRRCSEQERTAG